MSVTVLLYCVRSKSIHVSVFSYFYSQGEFREFFIIIVIVIIIVLFSFFKGHFKRSFIISAKKLRLWEGSSMFCGGKMRGGFLPQAYLPVSVNKV